MNYFKKIVHKIGQHFFLKNLVLAICGLVVFLFILTIIFNIFTRHGQKYEVPNLVGMTLGQTDDLTKEASLELVINDSLYVAGTPAGTILDQLPEPGSSVKSGRKIFLVINSQMPKSEVIPYVTGFSLRQAKNLLESKGFEIKRLIYRNDMATNNVIGQSYNDASIARGSSVKAPLGSGIVLTVGVNGSSPLPMVPKVIGFTLREAKSRLWEIGLNVGNINRDADVNDQNISSAKVYKQTPGQQARASYGSNVMLFLTTNIDKVNSGSKTGDANASRISTTEDITDAELEKLLKE